MQSNSNHFSIKKFSSLIGVTVFYVIFVMFTAISDIMMVYTAYRMIMGVTFIYTVALSILNYSQLKMEQSERWEVLIKFMLNAFCTLIAFATAFCLAYVIANNTQYFPPWEIGIWLLLSILSLLVMIMVTRNDYAKYRQRNALSIYAPIDESRSWF